MSQRDLKFRAWDSIDRKMLFAQLNQADVLESEKNSVMQYTGLKDKNGVEIYEGDICKIKLLGREVIAPMIWNASKVQFGLDAVIETQVELPDEWEETEAPEVLGNIYENPDLV